MASIVQSALSTPSSFPNIGVSIAFLKNIVKSPKFGIPMVELSRPDLTKQDVDTMDNSTLRSLAKELRVFSHLDGADEFALYDGGSRGTKCPGNHKLFQCAINGRGTCDICNQLLAKNTDKMECKDCNFWACHSCYQAPTPVTDEEWRDAVRASPSTTTHVNLCIDQN